MSKFCPQCGFPVSQTAKFCPSCGAVLKHSTPQAATTPPGISTDARQENETQKFSAYYTIDKNWKEMFFKSEGRLNRKRYILRTLLLIPIVLILALISALVSMLLSMPDEIILVLNFILSVIILVPSIMLSIRRCHDLDHSGWFVLLNFVPIGNIILAILLLFKKGTNGPNTYGPDPLKLP